MIPGVSLRYTPGYEPLASLGRSTFQVVLRVAGGFNTDLHGFMHGFPQYCVYPCPFCVNLWCL